MRCAAAYAQQRSRGLAEADEDAPRGRAFWSGLITFGLVSIPVDLYPGNRSTRISLRMLGPQGSPLHREYRCPEHETAIDWDEIVRGYEVSEGEYVTVTDEELEALEPRKSREIDLRRFVPEEDIDPVFFQRTYILAPSGDTTKAYHLLAETMEKSKRAGIATFVMRGKEYLVAILAAGGVLRAATLRFADEVRTPEQIGLPSSTKPKATEVQRIRRAIAELEADSLDEDELRDERARRILALVEDKEARGEVIEAPREAIDASEMSEVIDIMQLLKERLQGVPSERAPARRPATSTKRARARPVDAPARSARSLSDQSKQALYRRAQELGIDGRSRMSKDELIRAIRRAS